MAKSDVVVDIKFNFGFEGDVPDASTPEGASFRAAFIKALGARLPVSPSVEEGEPFDVTDEEAIVAARAAVDWLVSTTSLRDQVGARFADLDDESRRREVARFKAALVGGRLYPWPDTPVPEGEAERMALDACLRLTLGVARSAVLYLRAVFSVPDPLSVAG